MILEGPEEWKRLPRTAGKPFKIPWAPTMFLACPLSVLTANTWDVIDLVSECTGGENCDLLHLPFPGPLLDQPPWFREAVKIYRRERSDHFRWRMKKDREK